MICVKLMRRYNVTTLKFCDYLSLIVKDDEKYAGGSVYFWTHTVDALSHRCINLFVYCSC